MKENNLKSKLKKTSIASNYIWRLIFIFKGNLLLNKSIRENESNKLRGNFY